MLQAGLVSVTFRKLSVSDIVDLVVRAQLHGIEWGGDVHVPPGNLARATEVRQRTLDRGLMVAAYGSYYVVGTTAVPFDQILETAVTLGAPTIRVWAGTIGSRAADESHWQTIIHDGQAIADRAAAADVSISFEFHPDTLTDTGASTARLLAAIDRPNVYSYWQVGIDETPRQSAENLARVLPWLTNAHVFHWQPAYERQPLMQGEVAWQNYLTIIQSTQRDHFLLLEFVQQDSPDAFLRDAQCLTQWLQSFPSTHLSLEQA